MPKPPRLILAAACLLLVAAAPAYDWLSLCGQCLSPSITSRSGIGTAHAVAEAKISRKNAEDWCGNTQPDGVPACVAEQMAGEDAHKTFRATADCTAGRITAIDGNAYALAGVWTGDVGKGRTKWRDAAGKLVGQDNASNGLAIAEQWDVLCPGVTKVAGAGTAAPVPSVAAAPAGAAFAVGQPIEAKYFSDWVRGRVVRVRATGSQLSYEVVLDNGKGGVVPARMLRAAAPR